ncbi:hypothetical protein PoB_005911700 [Plakobranchus ocellatus]|uniref:Uncharacterized protein n=1 Tax=Plakobranchus ocellatus TaxID=259542 RepID=A0AAV4CM09_9GAST|nr:hypothetical protein PoB_005911700 [Plakobranchus ocellatus]
MAAPCENLLRTKRPSSLSELWVTHNRNPLANCATDCEEGKAAKEYDASRTTEDSCIPSTGLQCCQTWLFRCQNPQVRHYSEPHGAQFFNLALWHFPGILGQFLSSER